MIVDLKELNTDILHDDSISMNTYFIVRGLIAIAERLPQDTGIKKRLRDIIRNNKCSDYKNPSELESAVMSLVDELEKETV